MNNGRKKRPKKTTDEIAREVIIGKWGNDPEKSNKLLVAGYDPVVINRRVRELL